MRRKWLVSRICKEFSQLKNKKTSKTIFKNWHKIWTDPSPKKTYQWQIITLKDKHHHHSEERCKLNERYNKYLLEWSKHTHMIMPWYYHVVARMKSKWNFHILLVGMQNCIVILEKFGKFIWSQTYTYHMTDLPSPGDYLRETKIYVLTKTCT